MDHHRRRSRAGRRTLQSPCAWRWGPAGGRAGPRLGPGGSRTCRRPGLRGWGESPARGRTRSVTARGGRGRPGEPLQPARGRRPRPRPGSQARTRAPGVDRPAAPVDDRPVSPLRSLALTSEDEGPPDGLTLEQAIERLIRYNLDLRSKAFEIPQADADILTAGLRANPILYSDVQCVPYGSFSRAMARRADPVRHQCLIPARRHPQAAGPDSRRLPGQEVLEAQFQDATRIEIDNLYTRFVDVLAARETVRLARRASRAGDGARKASKAPPEPAARAPTTIGWRSSARRPRSA